LAEFADVKVTIGDYLRYRQFYALRDLLFYQFFVARPTPTQQDNDQLGLLQKQLDSLPTQAVDKTKLREYLQGIILVREAKTEFGITATPEETDQEIANQIGPVQGYSQYAKDATATAGVVYTAAVSIELATNSVVTPLPSSVTPAPTPSLAPTPLPIPSPAATAAARQQFFFDTLKQALNQTKEDYRRFEAEPTVVSRKVDQKLREQLPKIGDAYPQLRFSQILLKQEADAQAIYKDLLGTTAADLPAKFFKLAREKSLDPLTGARGGDVGWVINPMLSTDVLNVLKNLALGQVSTPIQTSFGWLVVLVSGKDEKRPLDAIQYEYLAGLSFGRSILYDDWLRSKIQAAQVKFFV
jgi:parvulin-like peptidyl-prolyl isomerase